MAINLRPVLLMQLFYTQQFRTTENSRREIYLTRWTPSPTSVRIWHKEREKKK